VPSRNAAGSGRPGVTMLGDGGSPGDMPSASVLDRRTLPAWVCPVGEDARAAPTASSGACMTGPYQRRHPCSHHPLPRRWIDGTDGVRAGVRAGLDCVADTCLEEPYRGTALRVGRECCTFYGRGMYTIGSVNRRTAGRIILPQPSFLRAGTTRPYCTV
jgi:hypothetical protein